MLSPAVHYCEVCESPSYTFVADAWGRSHRLDRYLGGSIYSLWATGDHLGALSDQRLVIAGNSYLWLH